MRKTHVAIWMVLGLMIGLAGCTTYYQVSDPASGNAYYTTKVNEGMGGSVKFKDQKSGSTVTLQSSEVKEISAEEFQAGLKAQPTRKSQAPAPAMTTQPAAAPASPAPAMTTQPAAAPESPEAPAQK